MPHISKRRKAFAKKVDHAKSYPALDAMKLIKETATAKFDEAVDVAVNLGIDAKKGDQTVRGSVVLPSGTGKAVRVVGQLGQILGPRGLMPNPKVGTVTPDVAAAVKNAKGGQVQFRADKAGIVQCTIGRASFTPEQLRDNLAALVDALNKAKPAATKGIFLKKLSVSSTMGIGVKVDPASLSAQQ
jgi:large subunit ribosomal protein L1